MSNSFKYNYIENVEKDQRAINTPVADIRPGSLNTRALYSQKCKFRVEAEKLNKFAELIDIKTIEIFKSFSQQSVDSHIKCLENVKSEIASTRDEILKNFTSYESKVDKVINDLKEIKNKVANSLDRTEVQNIRKKIVSENDKKTGTKVDQVKINFDKLTKVISSYNDRTFGIPQEEVIVKFDDGEIDGDLYTVEKDRKNLDGELAGESTKKSFLGKITGAIKSTLAPAQTYPTLDLFLPYPTDADKVKKVESINMKTKKIKLKGTLPKQDFEIDYKDVCTDINKTYADVKKI